MFLFEDMLSIL